MIIKTFFNWTTEDFTYPFAGEPQTFRAGESRMMEQGLAQFFAKHLADWQMDRQGIKAGERNNHDEFLNKCLIAESEPVSPAKANDLLLNQDAPKSEPEPVVPEAKKRGRPAKKVEEAAPEFEGVE